MKSLEFLCWPLAQFKKNKQTKPCGQRNVSDWIQPSGCRFVVSESPGTHGQHFVLCASLPLEDSSRGWCLHCLYSCQDTTILLGSISLSALVTVFFIFPILLEVTWYLTVVLIRISVLTNNLSIFVCVCVGHFYKFVGKMSIQIFRLFIKW